MLIENIKVYDLEESLVASGYPMRVGDAADMRSVVDNDWNRGLLLTKASYGNGAHAQWLTGVRVNFDVTFTNKAWVEAERYRFLEFVSSQSTMHRISHFDISSQCNEYVDCRIIEIVEELKQEYLKNKTSENYLKLLYNIPSGFKIKARLATNYRCLLNIYVQRFNHKLPEWREFCEELLNLPYFKEIVEAYLKGRKGE